MGYRYVHVYNIAESLSGVYCLHILVVSQRSSRDAWEDDEKTQGKPRRHRDGSPFVAVSSGKTRYVDDVAFFSTFMNGEDESKRFVSALLFLSNYIYILYIYMNIFMIIYA